MAQVEMFAAKANSPATELTAAITDVATTVSVLDASKLPDAPNIATIGVDESAETIKYAGKSGNTLTGVTRGFSGTVAKAWAIGVGVARYFTAYDADALRENVVGHSAELVGVNAQLAEKAPQSALNTTNSIITLTNNRRKLEVRKKNPRKFKPYAFPSLFSWQDAPIDIFTDGISFSTPFDVASFKNTGGVTRYVNTLNGNNVNDGLSEANAKKTIESALAGATNGDTIEIVDPEGTVIHPSSGGFNGQKVTKNINLIARNKVKIVSASHGYTYTADQNVWKYTGSTGLATVDRVVDLYYSDPIEYVKVSSVADCKASKGTFYFAGTDLWINTLNGSIHVDKILPLAGFELLMNDNTNQNVKIYVENIEFMGGITAAASCINTAAHTEPEFYAKNCSFGYNRRNRAAMNVQGAKYAIFQNCVAHDSSMDGFGYSLLNGTYPKAIEVDCVGRNNGINIGDGADNTYNGSTIHEGCKIIRVKGTYYNNVGMNVGDVGANAESVNLGCTVFDSASTFQVSFRIDFGCLSGAKMWLDTCEAFGSLFNVNADGTSIIYNRNSLYDTSSGNIVAY